MYSKLKSIQFSLKMLIVLGSIGSISCFLISFLLSNLSKLPPFYQDILTGMLPGILCSPVFFFVIAVLDILIIIVLWKSFNFNINTLKYKIKSNPNFTELEINQDFNSAVNIGKFWIGNKFTVFLSKNSDLIVNENLAWAFVLKSGMFNFIFTMDFDNNKNITLVHPKLKNKILDLLKEKCPNACIGYSEELENIAFSNIENVKNFDKSTLDPYYSPVLNNYKNLIE